MSLTDMKQPKKSRKAETAISEVEHAPYPYGLTLNLEDETLRKLGISGVPEVGTEMKVVGFGVVDSSNQHQSSRRKNRSITIQLQKLEVKPARKRTAMDALDESLKES